MDDNLRAAFSCSSPFTEYVDGNMTTVVGDCGCVVVYRNDDPDGYIHGRCEYCCNEAFARY